MDEILDELGRALSERIKFTDEEDEKLAKRLEIAIECLTKLECEPFRVAHAQLSGLLHKHGEISVPFLIFTFDKHFRSLSHLKIVEVPKRERSNLTEEEFQTLTYRCMQFQQKEGVRISTYRMPDITPLSAEEVLPWIVDLLNYTAVTPTENTYLNAEMAMICNYLGMSRSLTRKLNQVDQTYLQFESILQRLCLDGHQQLARDTAEEAFVCSHADGVPECGHYCRFTLFTSQMNPIDAALHACLLAMTLQSLESITNTFYARALIGVFTFYRTFGFFEFADSLHDDIQALPTLNEYDRQRITLAFLNMLLLKHDPDVLSRATSYVEVNFDAISAFGTASLLPWLGMICNLKTLYPGTYALQAPLIALESYIEANLPTEQIESIKDLVLRNRPNAKEQLRQSLEQLTKSRNISDHVHEANLLQVRASRVIETSLEVGDIEGILLGHQAKSDGSLAFDLAKRLPRHTLIRHDAETLQRSAGRFEDYLSQTRSKLLTHPDYRYVWLGFEGERTYFLIHEEGKFIAHGYIPGCTQSSVKEWLADILPGLGFNDSPPGQGPFKIREDIWSEESERIQSSVPKFHLPRSSKCTVVFSDVEMSCFPHNLLVDLTSEGQRQALCSPLSLDHYLRCTPIELNLSKVNVWAPLVEEDGAIELAYSRLRQHMDNHPADYEEGLLPSFESEADVKLFICHGGRDPDGGFTGLYPSDNKKYTTPSILGTGKVAVLFVCHGGHIATDIYARSFQTLAKTLLLAGYETVIAPAWSLNVTIPGPWTEVFLHQLKAGQNIVSAASEANQRIKQIYPVESAWAAMHVFGNPHLRGAKQ